MHDAAKHPARTTETRMVNGVREMQSSSRSTPNDVPVGLRMSG
ncbi:hypothetical protein RRSWK_02737 [Rhodopirellula sp. SWK7]|nr:hypothetical protein RRSWK_02737 [Rhodopirellula sp. SWK7]